MLVSKHGLIPVLESTCNIKVIYPGFSMVFFLFQTSFLKLSIYLLVTYFCKKRLDCFLVFSDLPTKSLLFCHDALSVVLCHVCIITYDLYKTQYNTDVAFIT